MLLGEAVRIDPRQLSKEHRAYVEKQLARRPELTSGLVSVATRSEEYDSGLEADYASLLAALVRSGAEYWDGTHVVEWWYHRMKFKVGHDRWYTPDFGLVVHVELSVLEIADGLRSPTHFRIVEVKGSWRSKNARESRAKLEAAALLNPWFQWEAVTKGRDGFEHEAIGG